MIYLLIILQATLVNGVQNDLIYMTESGHAEFTSRVPLHSFTGVSDHLTGMIDPAENLVDFYLDLNTLRTGIDRRDRDMFRTLNVNEYPFAEFTGSFASSFNMNTEEQQRVIVSGKFTINGVSRDAEIEGIIQKSGSDIHIQAEWTINLNDYNIDPPGILFYRVNEEQEIRIAAVLIPRENNSN